MTRAAAERRCGSTGSEGGYSQAYKTCYSFLFFKYPLTPAGAPVGPFLPHDLSEDVFSLLQNHSASSWTYQSSLRLLFRHLEMTPRHFTSTLVLEREV